MEQNPKEKNTDKEIPTITKDNCRFTRGDFPTSFKLEPINMTLEEIEKATKNAKVFIPYGGCGNLQGADIMKL